MWFSSHPLCLDLKPYKVGMYNPELPGAEDLDLSYDIKKWISYLQYPNPYFIDKIKICQSLVNVYKVRKENQGYLLFPEKLILLCIKLIY